MTECTAHNHTAVTEFPKEAQFKYSWRDYQQRVLDDLQNHTDDDHLHIIAPPGSGKTILGLEVMLRLNKPTLILAPTIAIRNQWIQRFCELFLQTEIIPDWVSRDIRNPGFLTVVTYQGLHAACTGKRRWHPEEISDLEIEETDTESVSEEELEHIIRKLQKNNVKTIVADEAHHLKRQWWQTLTRVKTALNPLVVGLTATPPYDVTPAEWERYIVLNGPVDSEISVPELVKAGDLCPHQDLVYFTSPTEKERDRIYKFRDSISQIYNELKTNETLIDAIEQSPLWQEPENHLNWIYNNAACYSASLIFLHENNRTITDVHLDIIGNSRTEIPPLSYDWMEWLLEFYLFAGNDFFPDNDYRVSLENKLRRYGAIDKNEINLIHNRNITAFLNSSISKLDAIHKIAEHEYNLLKNELRMVILTDYIRKEYLVQTGESIDDLHKIGVIPIFERLRRQAQPELKIGVLTGSVVIIPQSALNAFRQSALESGISDIEAKPLTHDPNYLLIERTEQLKNDIVHIITGIFQNGEIHILTGTKSLLGEGWDAPAINSLVLASFVGSFVLSNQMRGRAIRTQQNNPGKTANIWHLCCVDPTAQDGGDDVSLLERRFKGFVGISLQHEATIENGTGRLNIPSNLTNETELRNYNYEMFRICGEREFLKNRWKYALESGVTLAEQIKIPFPEAKNYTREKKIHMTNTIKYLIATLLSGILSFTLDSIEILGRFMKSLKTEQQVYTAITILGCMGVIIFGGLTIKTFRLYIKYRDISKDVRNIALALLHVFIREKIIQTPQSELEIKAITDISGAIMCHMEGGSTFEKSLFINTLHEIISPVENPRYIIIRKNRLMKFVKQKDYHAVPEVLARNKKTAEMFAEQWRIHAGSCTLVFTRNAAGRKLLLQARLQSLAAQFQDRTERISKWH